MFYFYFQIFVIGTLCAITALTCVNSDSWQKEFLDINNFFGVNEFLDIKQFLDIIKKFLDVNKFLDIKEIL